MIGTAITLHDTRLWHGCAVVEKYDATALGVSGGGGEYSVQSGERVTSWAMLHQHRADHLLRLQVPVRGN
jgi:hypothetical protein